MFWIWLFVWLAWRLSGLAYRISKVARWECPWLQAQVTKVTPVGPLPLPTFALTSSEEELLAHRHFVADMDYIAECDDEARPTPLGPTDAAAIAAAQRAAEEAAELEELFA